MRAGAVVEIHKAASELRRQAPTKADIAARIVPALLAVALFVVLLSGGGFVMATGARAVAAFISIIVNSPR